MTINDCDQKYLKALENYILSQFKILDSENVNYRYIGVHFSEDDRSIATRALIFKFIVVESFKVEIHFRNQRCNTVVCVNDMHNLPIFIVSTIQDAIYHILFDLAVNN